ncbi:MAG: TonB family protein [Aridibacter sp.]
MKYCPTCQTEYDEEIIRFCTKDGTPLIEDDPKFTELPSETSEEIEDDEEVQTVISRKKPIASETANLSTADIPEADKEDSQRIVISTKEDEKQQNVRPKQAVPPPPVKKTNTAFVILLTVFGTLAIIVGTIVVYSFLTSDNNENANENININADVNENPDDNFNSDDLLDNNNVNENSDENLNLNTNIDENLSIKTPNPTPPPKTPTPKPNENTNTNTNVNINVNLPNTNATATPIPATPRPTVAPTSVPTPIPPANTNRPVNVGTINGRAISLPTPAYPPDARQVKASGRVTVSVTVDESGNVVAAKATGGHPLLRRSAESAALRSRFKPVSVNGTPRKAVGTVIYNFVN